MRKSGAVAACVVFLACLWSFPVSAAPVYINGVPDWDQPIIAGPPPALNQGWNAWCVPTATANIMGYYRDKGVSNAIADALVFTNRNAWPSSDFQDDTADPVSANPPAWGVARGDIGYYMNTNDFGQTAANPGGAYAGTMYTDILPGLAGGGAFTGYLPAHAINNAVVQNAAVAWAPPLNTVAGGPFVIATVWPRIIAEMNANRPVLISFSHGGLVNRQQVRGTGPANLPDYDCALWASSNPGGDSETGEIWIGELGHSMTLVGYWLNNDPTNPFYNVQNPGLTPNAIIVHDNRDGFLAGKGLPLALPFNNTAPWVMNTEITLPAIPEPATMTLAALGFGALAWWRRK